MTPKPQRAVLVTGFTPFGGERTNPAWEIAKALPKTIAGYRIETLRVPTEFGRAIDVTTKTIDAINPAIVLCLGQAGGRARISVERVAINLNDAAIADNAGVQMIDKTVHAGAPAAYFSTLPVKAMVAAMGKAGVPTEVSNSAGTFVCNHLLYGVLHHLAASASKTRAGFIHVPYLPTQILDKPDMPSMALETMVHGVRAAIMAAIKTKTDVKLVGGKTH
jgi:pyroglutamyl-peptidase